MCFFLLDEHPRQYIAVPPVYIPLYLLCFHKEGSGIILLCTHAPDLLSALNVSAAKCKSHDK